MPHSYQLFQESPVHISVSAAISRLLKKPLAVIVRSAYERLRFRPEKRSRLYICRMFPTLKNVQGASAEYKKMLHILVHMLSFKTSATSVFYLCR
jgi:hypothetical protein